MNPFARQIIGKALDRGRIDMTIKYQSRSKNEVCLNKEVVRQLIQLQNDLIDIDAEIKKFSVLQMLEWPGALEVSGHDEKSDLPIFIKITYPSIITITIATINRRRKKLNNYY